MLAAEGAAGFLRRGEGVEARVGPVVQDGLEGGHDPRRFELLAVVHPGFAQHAVEGAGVEVDLAVVVAGADHVVEVDPAVEEAPGDVAHHRAQEGVGGNQVRAGFALGGPGDAREVFVAADLEGAELEAAVAGDGIGLAGDDFVGGEGFCLGGGFVHGHGGGPLVRCGRWVHFRQMSAHFSTDSGPWRVCSSSAQGLAASKR
ncbi:hypothetical protein D9M70_373660 [compost metagenome]